MPPPKLDPNEDAQTLAETIRHCGPMSRQQSRERLPWSLYRVHKAFRMALRDGRLLVLCHFHTLRHGNPCDVYDVPPGRQELIKGRLCACIPGSKREKRSYVHPKIPSPIAS